MTVAELIDESRDFHGSFTKQNIPDRACMRALSRYVRRLAEKVTALDEAALAVQETVDSADLLDAVTGRTGIVLPAHLLLLSPVYVVHTEGGYRVPVTLIDHASRNLEGAIRFPAASVMGQKLYPLNLMDVAGTVYGTHGWEDYGGLELLLVPLYADLTLPTSVIGLPNVCRDALVNNLALFMAGRRADTMRDLPTLPAQAQDAENTAVATLTGQSSTSTWRIG
jgi:hypothetical protein